eukprot:350773-Chlamydomonas_euryale.AAC.2
MSLSFACATWLIAWPGTHQRLTHSLLPTSTHPTWLTAWLIAGPAPADRTSRRRATRACKCGGTQGNGAAAAAATVSRTRWSAQLALTMLRKRRVADVATLRKKCRPRPLSLPSLIFRVSLCGNAQRQQAALRSSCKITPGAQVAPAAAQPQPTAGAQVAHAAAQPQPTAGTQVAHAAAQPQPTTGAQVGHAAAQPQPTAGAQ